MRDALNGMQELMTGDSIFLDETLLQDLEECFQIFDPEIQDAQDAQWKGFLDYGASGGSPDDVWEQCPPDSGLVSINIFYVLIWSNNFLLLAEMD